jgi:Family of unknown function (DUF5872)
MPTPNDKDLYEKIKKEITSKYKPSAYRSGLLVQKYKEAYFKKHKNNNAYSGNKSNSNLKRWFDERWLNQKGEVGYSKKGDIYRPTIRINSKTPTTFNELTKSQIERAKKEKAQTGKVKKFKI